jgi:diadenosine tetraphosphate (Ap4A) HIT family hydrolase
VPTLFTKIIDGDIPGEFVWRDDECVAFLSINPLSPGHTLVVPRAEIDHWLDCPAGLRDHLMDVSQIVGRAIQRAFSPERVGLIIAGFEVNHLHVHVFAAGGLNDFDFRNAGQTTPEDLKAAGERIRAALS